MSRTPIILHMDMNSYFASAEQQANPFLRGKPIAVIGAKKRTIVLAASIEAKKLGIATGMMVHEALACCPGLLLIHADGEKYLDIHERFLAILEQFTEQVEVFSVDEAFLDVTRDVQHFAQAETIARQIKERFRATLGQRMLCSIGIAPNKLLAKLASGMQKPDGLVVIRPEDIPAVLQRTPVQELCGIGPRLSCSLQRLGIQTAEDLGAYPEGLLRAKFGIWGHILHEMGQGRGSTIVHPSFASEQVQSVGHAYTLSADTTSTGEIRRVLSWLSEKVGRRLRRQRLEGRTVSLTIRQSDFSHLHTSARLRRYLSDGLDIFREAERLLVRLPWIKPIRLLGVSVGDVRTVVQQLTFFRDLERRRALARTLDAINDRFGEWTITRALTLGAPTRHHATFGGFSWKEAR